MDYRSKADELRRELTAIRQEIERLADRFVLQDEVDALSRRLRFVEQSVGHIAYCHRCGELSLALTSSNHPSPNAFLCIRCGWSGDGPAAGIR